MSGRSRKQLSTEDRILWRTVAKTVKPLAGKRHEEEIPEKEEFAALLGLPKIPQLAPKQVTLPVLPSLPTAQPAPVLPRGPATAMERATRARLAKGRLAIEGKVDLHGMTQSQAHALLLSFLRRAHADGRRHVLVVTGKGTSLGSEGVLRRAVPGWLATPPFRLLVSAHEPAAIRHGGSGALYVRLRRQREPS